MTCAPGGFVLTLSVPLPLGGAAGAKIQRDASSAPMAMTAVTTAAITNGRGIRRRGFSSTTFEYPVAGVGALHSDVMASTSGVASLCAACDARIGSSFGVRAGVACDPSGSISALCGFAGVGADARLRISI